MKRAFTAVVVLLALAGCTTVGQGTASSPTPTSASSPSAQASSPPPPTPTPTPSPSPPAVRAGAPAWVAVSVATLWRSPQSARAVDSPALANPVRIRQWLAALTATDQAGLIGRADSQALLGDRVNVLALSGNWARVVIPDQATPLDARGYPGWIPLRQLTAQAPQTGDRVATVIVPTTWLLDHGLPAMEVSFGTRLPVTGGQDSIVTLAIGGGKSLDVAANAVAVAAAGKPALPSSASSIVASMKAFLGVRYLWAGTSAFGYDCSGLMYNVFKAHGVTLPRDAQDQANVGTPVSRQALRPGDLVFLAAGGVVHHVAVYAGNGMLLDSPDLGRGIQLVSMNVAPYSTEYAGARRMVAS